MLTARDIRLRRPPGPDGSAFDLNVENLAVERGQACFLCGPSGSGKSTLLRILAGLEKPDSGEVVFRQGETDFDFYRLPSKTWRQLRQDIGVVNQDPRESLNDRRGTVDLVADPLHVHGLAGGEGDCGWLARLVPALRVSCQRRNEALDLLQRVGITRGQALRPPTRLSGGQRQRVAIARALISRPTLLFLDEPTSALDVSVQAGVMNLLARLRAERGLTLVLVTHALGLARQFAERVIVMDGGRVVEDGPTEAVLSSPQSNIARRLLEASLTPFDVPEKR
jgi:peptide/nickel transport system ATP-binding protein